MAGVGGSESMKTTAGQEIILNGGGETLKVHSRGWVSRGCGMEQPALVREAGRCQMRVLRMLLFETRVAFYAAIPIPPQAYTSTRNDCTPD